MTNRRTKGIPLAALLITPLLGAGLFFFGCSDSSPSSPDDGEDGVETPDFFRGTSLSPRGFPLDFSETEDFFDEVNAWDAGMVMWSGAWRDDVVDGTDAGEIPGAAQLTAQLAEEGRYMVVFGWRSGDEPHIRVPGDARNDWTNTTAAALYQDMVVEYADQHHPPFVFLGNENDTYFELDPVDFARWVAVYEGAYDAIKAVSPETMVGTVFNFEHMAGRGPLVGFNTENWGALEAHDLSKVDVIGLTTYPFFRYALAENVPSDYLQPALDRAQGTPVYLVETGWPAERFGGIVTLWTVSEGAQVDFVPRLEAMVQGRNIMGANWLFLHSMVDPGGESQDWQVFGSISLRRLDGSERPVHDLWIEAGG